MNKSILLAASLLAFNLTPVFGQPNPNGTPPPAPNFQQRLKEIVNSANAPQNQPPALTKFNLDFPGGTPAELVKAIEKATGKPLNAIIPTEDADIQLPPLKMNDVVTPQLFAALEAASHKTVAVQTSAFAVGFGNSYSQVETDYGFKSSDNPITDTSIWYFYAGKPTLPPVVSTEKIVRFYSLDPYLNRGFTVDDITTAIQTGWKMAGLTYPPELNYHKETKLLIAFGKPDELKTIDDVLKTLPNGNSTYTDMQSLYRNLNIANDRMNKLQHEVDQLTKTNSMSAASPEEKSGK